MTPSNLYLSSLNNSVQFPFAFFRDFHGECTLIKQEVRVIVLFIGLSGLLTTSCAVISDIPNRELDKLDKTDFKKLNGEFSNYPTATERKIEREMFQSNYQTVTLWDQISNFKHIEDTCRTHSVTLEFASQKRVIAKLWNDGVLQETKVIKGKMKNGYFYRRPYFIAIPLVPLVFGYDTDRYRIGLVSNTVVIDYKWNYWGFAIAAGSFSEGQRSSNYERTERNNN